MALRWPTKDTRPEWIRAAYGAGAGFMLLLAITLAAKRVGLGGRDLPGFYAMVVAVMGSTIFVFSIPKLPLHRARVVSVVVGALALIAILILREV